MNIHIENLLDRKTLVIGGIKSGKTRFACAFVEKVLAEREDRVAVLDLAPDLYRGVGGKMVLPDHPRLRYLTTWITAPRLRGRDPAEVLELAEGNRRRIEMVLESYLASPAPILVINDVTLFLHAGSVERLMEVASTAATLLVNAYFGEDFEEIALSLLERRKMELFLPFFDRVLRMERGHVFEERGNASRK
ncbi:MAG: hypothetical protein GX751_08145 [Desulfuromonadaceae bacterium]|nr:hypothetical protein [Desulfuromonadaceae bacterium]